MQNALLRLHTLFEEAGYWWEIILQGLEVAGTSIAQDNFKKEFLDEYFLTDVCNREEIEFLELKRGNMYVTNYTTKFEELSR